MPARDAPSTFVIPPRFHPGWSLVGRALRRFTGDRLRAGALHLVLSAGGALAWLMAVYAAEALAAALTLEPTVLYWLLSGAGLLLMLVSAVGFRPSTVVACGPRAVRIERGNERLRLPYAALASTETVEPRVYHRHYRHYAAVRPFLGAPRRPVLLLRTQGEQIVALGLRAQARAALTRRVTQAKQTPSDALEAARP